MPLGSREDVTGRLVRLGPFWALRTRDGGQWRIDGPARLDRLVGQSVRLQGTRTGYDWLTVDRALDPATGQTLSALLPWYRRLLIRSGS
jgi:hypothetical protein